MIKLKLTTLTPLFIGGGKELESFDYEIIGNNFYKINSDKILNYILNNDRYAQSKIDEWIEDTAFRNQQNPHQNLNTNNLRISNFVQNKLRNQQLLQDIRNRIISGEFSYYSMPSYLPPNYGKKTLSCIKTADNKVYIPGSTIKGMIRTALLNDYFQRMMSENNQTIISHLNIIKNELNRITHNPSDKDKKHFADKLLNEIFVCKGKNNIFDAKFDLMKFIKVSDSNYYEPKDVCELRRPDIVKRNGNVTPNLNALELIKPGVEFEFTLDFEINYFQNVYKKYLNDKNSNEYDWKELEPKFENLFQISLKELVKSNIKQIMFDNLFNSILNFSQFIAEIDDNFQKNLNNFKNLNKVKSALKDEIIVGKIGWGGGYHSKTIYSLNYFDECDNKKLFSEIYQKIIDKFRIGYSQNQHNNQQVDLMTVPKTRKAVRTNNFYEQFGWVKIERV